MPIDVTYGGTRTTGTAALSNGAVTFTADGKIDRWVAEVNRPPPPKLKEEIWLNLFLIPEL